MTIEWFICDGSGAAVHAEDPGLLLIGDRAPDWVRLPAELEGHGGRVLRVERAARGACPRCGALDVRHLELEASFGVGECIGGCGFVFYRRPAP